MTASILASAIATEFRLRRLQPTEGTSVFATEDTVVSVRGASCREFQDCLPADARAICDALHEFEHLALTTDTEEALTCGAADHCLLIVGDQALSLPEGLPKRERNEGIAVFARGFSHPVVSSMIVRWAVSEARLIASKPTRRLAKSLHTPPPGRQVAIAVGEHGSEWLTDDRSLRWGRFKPCLLYTSDAADE